MDQMIKELLNLINTSNFAIILLCYLIIRFETVIKRNTTALLLLVKNFSNCPALCNKEEVSKLVYDIAENPNGVKEVQK